MLTLLKYHFKAKAPLLYGMLLVVVCLQVLMFLGLRMGGFFVDSIEADWNVTFCLSLALVLMFALFIISYKLYRENVTNYYKSLLPVNNNAFILAPLLFWIISSSIAGMYFMGMIYLSSFIYEEPSELQRYIVELFMFDNFFVFLLSQVDFFIKSSVYLLLLFFAYTLVKLVVKGKKLRACMMAVMCIVFVVIDILLAKWLLKFVPVVTLGEKIIIFEGESEIVSYDFNSAHLFIMANLCILLIYSTAYLLKVRKDI